MRSPTLSELPSPPPSGRACTELGRCAGWPWTEESPQLPDTMPDGSPWPRMSIVTPSYNQAQFIEETIRSVLQQGYHNLEYVVIDGGSTDASVEIIRRHAARLHYWASEPDRGQYDAINKGFAHTTGEIMAWINSDDKYCPWAFQVVASIFAALPQVEWLTTSTLLFWNRRGELVGAGAPPALGYARTWFYRGWHLGNQPGFKGWIQQESTFWRRSLWKRAGGSVDDTLHYAADFELWARFWEHTDLVATTCPLAGFRHHPAQKTQRIEKYYSEAEQVLLKYRGRVMHNSLLLWLLEQLLRRTGRGGERFGSRLVRVDHDVTRDVWNYTYGHCI